jgi:ACS family sodium-dependent inorganic phosphate cotransporter-like MFS transporter 5
MSSQPEPHLKTEANPHNENYDRKRRDGFFVRVRHVVAGMVLLATLNLYMCRINLSEAIVAMSKVKKVSDESRNSSDVCVLNIAQHVIQHSFANETALNYSTTPSSHELPDFDDRKGEFDWDQKEQGVILGAFFYGYILFQVVGGRLAEMFGAKWLCAGGIGVSIVINALTPTIARTHNYYLLLASRVVLGVFQAFIFPSCYALFAKWAPDHERR